MTAHVLPPCEAADRPAMRAKGFTPADDNEADALALLMWAADTLAGPEAKP